MKNKTTLILLVFILFANFKTFGQVTTRLYNMTYSIGGSISECGNINFGSNSTITLNFCIYLDHRLNEDGLVNIYTKQTSSSTPIQRNTWVWNTSAGGTWVPFPINGYYHSSESNGCSVSVTLNASDFNASGGKLYASFRNTINNVESKSCEYSIIKQQSSFALTPSPINITCGSTTPVIFTISDVNSAPGSINYNWNVGGSWKYNGSPAPNVINTTVNTITLTPNTLPLSNISVTPILNNVNQSTIISTVNYPAFTSSAVISGNINTSCNFPSNSIFTINAGAGNSVSWSSSDTNVAFLSSPSNTQVTVNSISSGSFTLNALITNQCGQQTNKTKTFSIGTPSFQSFKCGGMSRDFCSGSPINVTSNTLPILDINDKVTANYLGMTAVEAYDNTNWEWQAISNIVSVAKTKNLCRIGLLSYGQTGVRVRARNSCGWSPWTDLLFEIVEIPPVYQRLANNEFIFSVTPNPAANYIFIDIKNKEKSNTIRHIIYKAELFDILNVSRKKIELRENKGEIDVMSLESGIYILKIYFDGKIENHQIIVK